MTKTTTKPAEVQAEQKPTETPEAKTSLAAETVDDGRTKFAAELKRYQAKFGEAEGATYFSDGLSWEAALERHVDALATAKTAYDAAKLSAEQRLAALNLGESKAVDTASGKASATSDAKTSFSACFQAATKKAGA